MIELSAAAGFAPDQDVLDIERPRRNGAIKIHGPEGFDGMRRAGQLASAALDYIAPFVKPGVTTDSSTSRASRLSSTTAVCRRRCTIAASPSRSALR